MVAGDEGQVSVVASVATRRQAGKFQGWSERVKDSWSWITKVAREKNELQ